MIIQFNSIQKELLTRLKEELDSDKVKFIAGSLRDRDRGFVFLFYNSPSDLPGTISLGANLAYRKRVITTAHGILTRFDQLLEAQELDIKEHNFEDVTEFLFELKEARRSNSKHKVDSFFAQYLAAVEKVEKESDARHFNLPLERKIGILEARVSALETLLTAKKTKQTNPVAAPKGMRQEVKKLVYSEGKFTVPSKPWRTSRARFTVDPAAFVTFSSQPVEQQAKILAVYRYGAMIGVPHHILVSEMMLENLGCSLKAETTRKIQQFKDIFAEAAENKKNKK